MKNISVLILILLYSYVNTQVIEVSVPSIVANAAYIFEGKVIRSDSYWATQERMIYTSHTIEISKIFKGNISCGTVEIITEGGETPDMRLYITHNLELGIDSKGIFFCGNTSMELPSIDYYPETNAQALSVVYSEQGFFREYEDAFNKEVSNLFYSFDSLSQAYDVVELLTQVNYIDCQATIIPSSNNQIYQVDKSIKEEVSLKKSPNEYVENLLRQKLESTISLKTQTTTLTYTFENVKITGVSPRYLEFDIYLAADDNNSYLDNGAISVYYDTAVFGTYIYANGSLNVTRGTMLASVADYQAPDSLTTDNAIDIFNVILYARSNPNSRYNVTTTPTQAIHLKMKFNNCKIPSVIGFTNLSWMKNNSLYTTTNNAPTSSWIQYGNVDATDYDDLPVCYPVVTDFSPKIVNGGVGDLITIKGNFFEQNQGNGKVYLKNADDGGATFISLDTGYDYTTWNDTSIVIIVPSIKYPIGNEARPAGSGPIRVETNLGDTTNTYFLPQPFVEVIYSIDNRGENLGGSGQKKQLDLMDAYGSQLLGDGGYLFNFSSQLSANSNAFKTIKRAINDWRCLTHVHFEVGDTLMNWTKVKAMRDSLNVIQHGNTSTSALGVVLMSTRLWVDMCPTQLNPFVGEIDIIIKDTNVWLIDTTGAMALGLGQFDFYSVILHELGYAHALNHVNNPNEIMYYKASKGPLAAANRRIILSNSCIQGGNNVINHSVNTSHGNCSAPLNNMILISGFNCTTPIQESVISDTEISIFPNPATNTIFVDFGNLNGSYTLSIIDATGKAILVTKLPITNRHQEVDISTFSAGLYYLSITNNNSQFNSKFIKQ